MHQIVRIDFTIFLRFWGGTSPSDTPLSPQAPKFCKPLMWAPPLFKNPGSAPVHYKHKGGLKVFVIKYTRQLLPTIFVQDWTNNNYFLQFTYRRWDDKNLYLKNVKCSGGHKNIHCCQYIFRSCKLQGSGSSTPLPIDKQNFVSTKSDFNTGDKKNFQNLILPKSEIQGFIISVTI